MSEPSPSSIAAKGRTRPRWRRRWIWLTLVALLVLLPILGLIGVYWYNGHQAALALEAAVAATDQLDSQWRLEEIERRRAALPPEQNAALPIIQAAALIPDTSHWPKEQQLQELEDGPPQFQLDPQIVEPLRKA